MRTRRIKLIIKHIVDLVAVDGQQRGTGKARLLCRGTPVRARDLYRHVPASFCGKNKKEKDRSLSFCGKLITLPF